MKQVKKLWALFCVLLALSGAAAAEISGNSVVNGKLFNELEGMSSERQQAILQLYESNIIGGYSDGSFHPDETVTRGQFVKIIMNAVGKINNSLKSPYPDVTSSIYYYHHAATANKLGYMTGYSDGNFHGDYTLNRGQICTVIGRILQAEKGYSVKDPLKQLSKYDDEIPAYAQESVALLTSLGILDASGGQFNAYEEVNRGEVAELICRMLKYL